MRLMRTVRNFAFLLFASILVAFPAERVLLGEGCTALGLAGVGATAEAARSDCYADGNSRCESLCQAQCGATWLSITCSEGQGSGPYYSTGHCNCADID